MIAQVFIDHRSVSAVFCNAAIPELVKANQPILPERH
jgi:hypothetical protein